MRSENGIPTRTGQPPKVQRLGDALDHAERELTLRADSGEPVDHGHFDYVDPATGHLLHDRERCPACALRREFAAPYRAAVRALVIKRGHNENRRIRKWDDLWLARDIAMARLGADWRGENLDYFPLNVWGDPVPLATTLREQIDAAAEVESLETDMEVTKARRQTQLIAKRGLRDLGLAFK